MYSHAWSSSNAVTIASSDNHDPPLNVIMYLQSCYGLSSIFSVVIEYNAIFPNPYLYIMFVLSVLIVRI